jgi:phosphatidylglycerophosphate synthase
MTRTTWAHRAMRPLVRPLITTPISPNHLTALRLVTGLGAAWQFSHGANGWAGVLFVISAFLDRADGELARMAGRTSRLGHHLDLGSDIVITALVFVSIGIGLREHALVGDFAVGLGITAGVAVALIFPVVMQLDALGPSPFAAHAGFDADDLLFLVGPIAWLGGLPWLLLAAAAGAPVFFAAALYRWRNILTQARQPH